MKVSVKPLDLIYHLDNPFHPLTLCKEEPLPNRVNFPKYSKEAFLEDVGFHSKLRPVSDFDSFTVTTGPSSPDLAPLTPIQRAYWLHADEQPFISHFELGIESVSVSDSGTGRLRGLDCSNVKVEMG